MIVAVTLAAVLAAAAQDGAAAGPPDPGDPGARLEAANARYLEGDFADAARRYAALVADGWESPSLHLNRGNALLRLGHRGPAIASWERALRLDPGDADAAANLELARARNVDRVLGATERSFSARVVARASDGAATLAFAIPWVLLWVLLAARRRLFGRARAAAGALAIAAAVLAVAGAALLGGKVLDRRTASAVVTAGTAPVREGPHPTLRPAFELHEGTRVRLLDARGELARVRLDNGLEGWIASRDLEVI